MNQRNGILTSDKNRTNLINFVIALIIDPFTATGSTYLIAKKYFSFGNKASKEASIITMSVVATLIVISAIIDKKENREEHKFPRAEKILCLVSSANIMLLFTESLIRLIGGTLTLDTKRASKEQDYIILAAITSLTFLTSIASFNLTKRNINKLRISPGAFHTKTSNFHAQALARKAAASDLITTPFLLTASVVSFYFQSTVIAMQGGPSNIFSPPVTMSLMFLNCYSQLAEKYDLPCAKTTNLHGFLFSLSLGTVYLFYLGYAGLFFESSASNHYGNQTYNQTTTEDSQTSSFQSQLINTLQLMVISFCVKRISPSYVESSPPETEVSVHGQPLLQSFLRYFQPKETPKSSLKTHLLTKGEQPPLSFRL